MSRPESSSETSPAAITLSDILAARQLVQKHLIPTPLVYSPEFSQASGNQVYFKLESFQRTHAFKARGALNKVSSLSAAERSRGVMAASSGNHALGVAFASALLGIEATLVMPVRAPATKIDQAKRYGASVILHGETYDEALEYARSLSAEQGKALLPSFDDPKVIAGQGTLALEVLEARPEVDLFVGPIGGGGLISGLLVALSELEVANRLVSQAILPEAVLSRIAKRQVQVMAVQAQGSPSMVESVRAGKRTRLPHIQTIADGIAVQQPGALNFDYVQRGLKAGGATNVPLLKDILTVDDEQIFHGMQRMLWDMRVIVEPAAAAAPATLLFSDSLRNLGATICCIITGGNISQAMLADVVSNV